MSAWLTITVDSDAIRQALSLAWDAVRAEEKRCFDGPVLDRIRANKKMLREIQAEVSSAREAV